jgi:hypothetical protein
VDSVPILLLLAVGALVGGVVGLLAPRSVSPLRRVLIAVTAALSPFVLVYLFVVLWFAWAHS